MNYLQRLPVRILKIDRSFVANMDDDERSCTLVRSMVVMGEALGLEVVIEGIERLDQLEHLTRHAGRDVRPGLPVRAADVARGDGGAARRPEPAGDASPQHRLSRRSGHKLTSGLGADA